MLFVIGVFALLASRALAQDCECSCTVDDCFRVLAGATPFPSQASVNDCRSFLWTSSTVAGITITETVTGVPTPPVTPTPSVTATAIPEQALGACSNAAAYSSACECIGIPAGGTTYIYVDSTTTTITVPAATPDTSCGSAGLELAIYENPFTTFTPPNYPEFSPQYFKSATPYDTGRASALGIHSADDMINPHGLTPTTPDIYTLNYRGYFYAPNTTTYTFRISDTDDYSGFWTGSKAQTGWIRANRDGESVFRAPSDPPVVAQIQVALSAGEYIPLRIIYANRGGAGKYTFDVFDGAGFIYVQYGDASPYLVSESCLDPDEAPPYTEPFGQET